MTQEALAEFIGVTKTSVSKWETGTTLPDIQILPFLASYFEVSIDDLLAYTPMLSREQIQFQYHHLAKEFSEKPFPEVMEECEKMIKKYYACYDFLQQMVVLLINHMGLATLEQEKEHTKKIAYDLCEHIITDCQDVGICNNVIALREMLLLQCGRPDLVIEEIEDETLNVNRIEDKGTLLTLAYLMTGKLEQAQKTAQVGMYRNLMDLLGYGEHLLQATELWTREEAEEQVLERLERFIVASKQLFADGIQLHGDDFFNHLDEWFQDLELGISGVRNEGLVRDSVIQGLQHPLFAQLNNQERLQQLREEIEHA